MRIGLYDMDGHNFPNLALMKLSSWHKQQGDKVEPFMHLKKYDKVYVAKVFGEEYSAENRTCINAKEVVFGGTGYAIGVENSKEVYNKEIDKNLPHEIEHIYPDYDQYPELTKNTAYGFLTRGCPNGCPFCIVWQKEGKESKKVANLSEFWRGQKYIKIMDGNLLACKERKDLLQQLIDSKAKVDFTQGLDARFITEEVALMLKRIKKETVHFAFDFMKNEKAIINGLKLYADICGLKSDIGSRSVYMLTNYDTSHEEDVFRVEKIKECGFAPFVMIYRKSTAPQITKDLQRWCNNRVLYQSCDFSDYVPRADGKTIKEIYEEKQK